MSFITEDLDLDTVLQGSWTEVSRIVAALHNPDQPPEQLLEVVSFRRADGREGPPLRRGTVRSLPW